MSDFTRLLCFTRPIILTFAQGDALTSGSLIETMRDCRPTEFVAVPRVYEKFAEVVEASIA